MDLWLPIIAAGILTYAIRLSMFVFVDHDALPPLLRQALPFVTPAVLAGIIVPAVLYGGGDGAFDAASPRVAAAFGAASVALLTRNVWATIASGMIILWLIEAIV